MLMPIILFSERPKGNIYKSFEDVMSDALKESQEICEQNPEVPPERIIRLMLSSYYLHQAQRPKEMKPHTQTLFQGLELLPLLKGRMLRLEVRGEYVCQIRAMGKHELDSSWHDDAYLNRFVVVANSVMTMN